MTEEKKNKNPFANLATAAKAIAAGAKVSGSKATQIQAKYKQTGVVPKSTKKPNSGTP